METSCTAWYVELPFGTSFERIIPPLDIAVPHGLMTDDVYRGLHVPAKSFIFPNTWSVSRKCVKMSKLHNHLGSAYITKMIFQNQTPSILTDSLATQY